jgi:hypothetical protein
MFGGQQSIMVKPTDPLCSQGVEGRSTALGDLARDIHDVAVKAREPDAAGRMYLKVAVHV